MPTADDFREAALSLAGTIEAPHFDRTAFKVAHIFATLAADGLTANLMLKPEEQALKVSLHPEAYSPVPGGWGRRGVTTVQLDSISMTELEQGLLIAWQSAQPMKRPRKKK